jgi:hypothetical protein
VNGQLFPLLLPSKLLCNRETKNDLERQTIEKETMLGQKIFGLNLTFN